MFILSLFNEYSNRVIGSYNFNDNVEYLTEFETIQPRNSFERVNRLYLMADHAAKQVLLCAWRKSGTSCRGSNSPLAPACFQHFGQLPMACKRPAISPLSNLVLAAYHRSDDQITWPLVRAEVKASTLVTR